jgi:GMP synthase-like glutamine amidotransferase
MPESLRIGILQTDRVVEPLRSRHGDYPELFAAIFTAAAASLDDAVLPSFLGFDVVAGEPPDAPTACDAWVITGSAASVYDGHPWIGRLEGFLRAVRAAEVPLLGICFGHQLVAQAFGGRVEKAATGWHVGQHPLHLSRREPWMRPAADRLLLPASHQDQVVELPPGAVLLGGHATCPVGAFRLGRSILCVQGHPEFTAAYGQDLVALRRERVGAELAEAGLRSYRTPGDQLRATRWLLEFVRTARVGGVDAP